MGAAWLAPLVEVTPQGSTADTTMALQTSMGSAQSVWFGVRPNDVLELKEVEAEKDHVVIVFQGVGRSKKRDTKLKLMGSRTFADYKGALDALVSVTDPVDPSWPANIRAAIANRTVANGMTKRQAYLVVGEPTGATVSEEGGKKVETWTPRQSSGMRIGYGAQVEQTGYPGSLRFVDGALTGVATGVGGGVNLDD